MFGMGKGKKSGKSDTHTDKETVTKTVQGALDLAGFSYNYNKSNNVFMTGFMGDDLPISMNILISDTSVRFISYLNLKSNESRYRDVCWELNKINKDLAFGSFYLDPEDGMISFEYGFLYVETDVSPEFILLFLKMFVETVDKYDGDLKKLAESVPNKKVNNTMYG